MSSSDIIIKRIEDEAKAEADAILAEAVQKAKAITDSAASETEALVDKIEKEAENQAQETRRRRLAVAEMEARKAALAQKQRIIDEAFDLALQDLAALPEAEIEALVTPMVLEAAEGGEELVVPAKDRVLYEKKLLKKLNGAMAKANKPGNLRLSAESGNFVGGVVLASDTVEKNATFEAVLRSVREENQRAIAELLFS